MRQLVRVENLDRPEAPLLAPQQQYFLRENLKLRLLAARFDLLFRDQAGFRADLAAADAWLRKYFDTRAQPVQTVQTALETGAGDRHGGRDTRSCAQPRGGARPEARAREAAALTGFRTRQYRARSLLVPDARGRGRRRRARGQAQRRLRVAGCAAISHRAVAEPAIADRRRRFHRALSVHPAGVAHAAPARAGARLAHGSRRSSAREPCRIRPSSRCSKGATARPVSTPRKRWRFPARRR